MSRGKYLSLEEARGGETKGATIKQFCKEHPSDGDDKKLRGMDLHPARAPELYPPRPINPEPPLVICHKPLFWHTLGTTIPGLAEVPLTRRN